MKKKIYVYVFTAEQAFVGECEDVIVRVFATEEAAKKFMHDFIHEGDEYVEEHGWIVACDEPNYYMACEDGNYPTNHIECTITKCEIN